MTPDSISPFAKPKSEDVHFRIAPHVIGGLTLAFALVAGFGGWAAVARLEGAIIAPGSVKVDLNVKEVQHRDGGIVKSIAVRPGDAVKEGQVLVTLDEVQTRAELQIVRAQLAESLGRRARLIAERDNLEDIVFPAQLGDLSAAADAVVSGERRLFEGNRQTRESQKGQLELGIAQIKQEIAGNEARKQALTDEIKLVEVERNKVHDLFRKELISNDRVYSINREIVRLQGSAGEIEAGIARARTRISEARLQIIAIDQNARTDAQRELRQIDAKIAELSERHLAIQDRLTRMDIRAPISGTVNELSIHTVGGVVTPAAKIMTIVPEGGEMRVEIKISPNDINQVVIGQPARLRFTSFQHNMTPELNGKLVNVSAASVRDPATGQPYYTGEVQISSDPSVLGRPLVPGMPVEVFVSTQERTALSYMVKPVVDQFNRAFRER
ncbi:HlyD family type I secretion periplasmic adaptor subunit [Alsobacter sp. R-9]